MRRLDRNTRNRLTPVEMAERILDELVTASKSDSSQVTLTFQRRFKPLSETHCGLGVRIDSTRVYTLFEFAKYSTGLNPLDGAGTGDVFRTLANLTQKASEPRSKVGRQLINFVRDEARKRQGGDWSTLVDGWESENSPG